MAFNSTTTQKLIDAVTHVLNKTPDSRRPAIDVVNDALTYLCDLAQWSWKQALLSLDFTANFSQVNLPTDFDSLKTVKSSYGTFRDVAIVSLEKLSELRQFAFASSFELYVAVSWRPPVDDELTVQPILEIFPTPSASASNSLNGFYLRRIPALDVGSPTAEPQIPEAYHALLLVLCRAMAVSSEESQAGEDWRLFNQMLDTYTDKDGRISGWNAGKMRNLVGRSAYPLVSQFWPNGNITAG